MRSVNVFKQTQFSLKDSLVYLPPLLHVCMSTYVRFRCFASIVMHIYLSTHENTAQCVLMASHCMLLVCFQFEQINFATICHMLTIVNHSSMLLLMRNDLVTFMCLSFCINFCKIILMIHANSVYYIPYICACILDMYSLFSMFWTFCLCTIILQNHCIHQNKLEFQQCFHVLII